MAKKNEIIVNAALKYKDDGAIHIFSHGAPNGLSVLIGESKEYVRTADELEALLSQYSEIWQNKAEKDNITIVFHACRTGQGEDSFAQKVSETLWVTVIAPSEKVYFSNNGEIGTYQTTYNYENDGNKIDKSEKIETRSDQVGQWKVFRNGKAIATYKGSWKPKERPYFFEKIIYKE